MKDWKKKLERYGWIGLAVWWAVFFSSIALFYTLIEFGVQWTWLQENVGTAGSLAAAYVVTKLLMPARAVLTLALVPFVARWTGRVPA